MNRIYELELDRIDELEEKVEELKRQESDSVIFGEHDEALNYREQRKEIEEIIEKLLKGEE